jgi:hypothetical protein
VDLKHHRIEPARTHIDGTHVPAQKSANDTKNGDFTASRNHFIRYQKIAPGFLFAFYFLMEVPSATQCQLWLCSQTFAVRIRQTANFGRTEMSKEV